MIEHEDAVALSDGGQAVGNDNAGTLQPVQRLRHLFLCDVVQRACRLVEHQNLGLRRDGAGNHQPLALPAGYAA